MENPNKTIKEWLSEIEDVEIRAKALANLEKDPKLYLLKDLQIDSLFGAIQSAFDWSDSPEGHTFWMDFQQSLIK